MNFTHKVAMICLAFGGSVTSWIRSKKHNKVVGGANRSLHLIGLAADVVFDTGEGKALGIHFAERLGLKVLDEGDHVHIQEK